MSYFRTSGEDDPNPNDQPVIDFDPNDPDATIVHYDLSAWTPDDQAELAAELANRGVAHAWGEGNDLLVPELAESAADAVIEDMEVRLGVGMGVAGSSELAADEPGVEYDLAEWPERDLAAIASALKDSGVRHRWEASTLIVDNDDEETVDGLLDAVERGDVIGEPEEDDGEDSAVAELPFETLTTFFLAGERLARNPLDADGLSHLMAAVDVADPGNPPYGVDRGLWQKACGLADDVAGALADGDAPDRDAARELAGSLRDLLRTSV